MEEFPFPTHDLRPYVSKEDTSVQPPAHRDVKSSKLFEKDGEQEQELESKGILPCLTLLDYETTVSDNDNSSRNVKETSRSQSHEVILPGADKHTRTPGSADVARPMDTRRQEAAVVIAINPSEPITPELIGRRVAGQLGFTETEMVLYSSLKRNANNLNSFRSGPDAFWQVVQGLDEKTAMELVRKEAIKNNGMVRIAELNEGAFQEKRDWLAEYRKQDGFHQRLHVEFHQRTPQESVATHLINPALNLSSAAMQSLASIGDGVALMSVNPHEKRVYAECAQILRSQAENLPMNDLYTSEEKQDIAIGLMTLYMQAFGDNLPAMVGGKLVGMLGKATSGVARTSGALGEIANAAKTSATTAQVIRPVPTAAMTAESAMLRAETTVADEASALTRSSTQSIDVTMDSVGAVSKSGGSTEAISKADRAFQLAEQHIPTALGVVQSAGQTYDSSKTVQAYAIACREFASSNVSTRQLEARVQEIKRGDGIDAATKEQIERKATIAAVLAASAGGVEGFMIGRLVRAVQDGISIDSLPQRFFDEAKRELKLGNASGALASTGRLVMHGSREAFKGAATGVILATGMTATEEGAFAIAGVKDGRQAFRDFMDSSTATAGQTALLFGSGQLMQIRLRGEKGIQSARKMADERHITYGAFRYTSEGDHALSGFTREQLPLPGEIDYQKQGERNWAVTPDRVEHRVYSVKGSELKIEVPEDYALKLDEVRELRNVASKSLIENPMEAAKIWKARQDLAKHTYKDAMLPEQAARLVAESPNGKRVASVSLHQIHPEKAGQAGASDITMFGANADAAGARTFMHEWSHVADQERITETPGRFRAAAAVEKEGYYLIDYARKNDAENFAVNMGDGFLGESPSKLYEIAEKAPLRSVATALILEQELHAAPNKNPHEEQIRSRIEYVKGKSVPLAKEDIMRRISNSTSQEELQNVKNLIDEFSKHESSRQLFGEDFLRRAGTMTEARLRDPANLLVFQNERDAVIPQVPFAGR